MFVIKFGSPYSKGHGKEALEITMTECKQCEVLRTKLLPLSIEIFSEKPNHQIQWPPRTSTSLPSPNLPSTLVRLNHLGTCSRGPLRCELFWRLPCRGRACSSPRSHTPSWQVLEAPGACWAHCPARTGPQACLHLAAGAQVTSQPRAPAGGARPSVLQGRLVELRRPQSRPRGRVLPHCSQPSLVGTSASSPPVKEGPHRVPSVQRSDLVMSLVTNAISNCGHVYVHAKVSPCQSDLQTPLTFTQRRHRQGRCHLARGNLPRVTV